MIGVDAILLIAVVIVLSCGQRSCRRRKTVGILGGWIPKHHYDRLDFNFLQLIRDK